MDDLISINEAAGRLGLTRKTVHRRVRELVLPVFSTGSDRRKRLVSWSGLREALKPTEIALGAHGLGTTGYLLFSALGEALHDATGMSVRVLPEESELTRARLLKSRAIDLVGYQGGIGAQILEAENGFASEDSGPFPIRDCYPCEGWPWVTGFFVRADSPIRSVWDIKRGVRISDFASVPAVTNAHRALLSWAGIDPRDAVFVPHQRFVDSLQAVVRGEADIALASPAGQLIQDIEQTGPGIRWLDVNPGASDRDRAGADRFSRLMGTWSFAQNQQGVRSSLGFWGITMYSSLLVHADADPVLVYKLVKWIAENYEAQKDRNAVLGTYAFSNVEKALPKAFIPIHEGAVRYFRERGIWDERCELRQRHNLWLVNEYLAAWERAVTEARRRGVAVDPSSEAWMGLWREQKSGLPQFKVMSDEEMVSWERGREASEARADRLSAQPNWALGASDTSQPAGATSGAFKGGGGSR